MLAENIQIFEVEQNQDAFVTIAGYLETLTSFVNDSNVTIDSMVNICEKEYIKLNFGNQ